MEQRDLVCELMRAYSVDEVANNLSESVRSIDGKIQPTQRLATRGRRILKDE